LPGALPIYPPPDGGVAARVHDRDALVVAVAVDVVDLGRDVAALVAAARVHLARLPQQVAFNVVRGEGRHQGALKPVVGDEVRLHHDDVRPPVAVDVADQRPGTATGGAGVEAAHHRRLDGGR